MLRPLAIRVQQFGTDDDRVSHIRAALALGLPEIAPALCAHDGTFVIVGSGPSMPAFIDDIKAERALGRPICSLKGTHDYLIREGCEPTFWLSVDPRPRLEQLTERGEDIIYLLASRCHPDLFARLKDERVMLFHTGSSEAENAMHAGKMMIGGGTTSGMRAMGIAYIMGFRKFVLYGFDSCLAADNKTKRFDGGETGLTVDVIVNGRRFLTNHAMAQQANEFQLAYQMMPGITVEAKGDGLIAEIIKARRAKGVRA